MDTIKHHLNLAYQQLLHLTVGGEAKMPVGVAMSHLVSAMEQLLEREREEGGEHETS